MLPGFEDITHDLTDYELKILLPMFLKGFEKKIGIENAITNRQILKGFQSRRDNEGKPYEISDVRVRKIINHIRINHLVPGLVASSKGYYITNDPKELKRYIDSLDGREMQIRRVKQGMKEYLKKLINGNQTQLGF